MKRPASSSLGFTLLEVLVALVILALALGAAIKGTSASAGNATYMRDKTMAHWVALNKVAELQLAEKWPPIGDESGEAEMGLVQWRWTTRVSETPNDEIRRLEVEVRRQADDEDNTPLVLRVAFLPMNSEGDDVEGGDGAFGSGDENPG